MPIYEYKCNGCNSTFEEIQKFSDAPIDICKHCDSTEVEKLISQSSFVLKGGGWYADGYTKGSKKSDKESVSTKPECAGCPSASTKE